MQKSILRLEQHNSIAHLIMDAPPANQMGLQFFEEFTNFIENIVPSLNVTGMIVYGSGRHFSSGAIVPEIVNVCSESNALGLLQKHSRNFSILESLPFPVVAAVRGCCLGSGLELALSCHFRIAAERSVFALPESSFGILPGCGGSVRLTKKIKLGVAIELLISGRTFLADEACAIGVVDHIVSRNHLIDTAEKLIRKIVNA